VAGAVAREIRKHVQAALHEEETKRLLEVVQHDLQVARSIQQSLLPQEAPCIEGFEIAGWNRPADDTGGGYFDWKILPNGKVVVSLADVTGHGIGPALLASVCHAYARSSFGIEQDLSKALERINHELGAHLTAGRFVTFVAAVCCPGCPNVEMLSAGHGPILIDSRPQDRFNEINAHALPLAFPPRSTPILRHVCNLTRATLYYWPPTAFSNGRTIGVNNSVCLEWNRQFRNQETQHLRRSLRNCTRRRTPSPMEANSRTIWQR
jgi:serine phosphatase RsbU (regulator of sigma subunit)